MIDTAQTVKMAIWCPTDDQKRMLSEINVHEGIFGLIIGARWNINQAGYVSLLLNKGFLQ